jgi:hypothetical protein
LNKESRDAFPGGRVQDCSVKSTLKFHRKVLYTFFN